MLKADFGLGADALYPSLEDALSRQKALPLPPKTLTASGACLTRICSALRGLPSPDWLKEGQSFTWRGDLAAVVWDNLSLVIAEAS